MKKFIVCLSVLMTGLLAQSQPPKVPANSGDVFGEKTTAENAITVNQLFSIMAGKKENKEMTVKLKGKVTQVCEKEGCWIKVQSPDGSMMVKMKDHKFTVPLVLHGKEIVIHGIAEEKTTTVEQLRHYAEDAGKSKEEIAKIKEPKREITVQAKGILVL
jgi:uncharacterized protein YdeI (BOF family)